MANGLYINPSVGIARGRSESSGGGAHGFAALGDVLALCAAGNGVEVEVGVEVDEWI